MITLTLKEQPVVPLEAEVLSPDVIASLSNDAIRALPVYLGKTQCRVDDFFTVEGEASDELEIHGDAKQVKWIGRGMTRGRITIVGNAGMHSRGVHEGRRDRSLRQRLRLAGRRDVGRIHPRRRQRRRTGWRGLSRQPWRDDGTAPSSSTARRASKSGCA